MEPLFFKKQSDLRKWFEKNHAKRGEVWIGYYKKGSGKESITWSQSVDEALCFGWIDGIRKSFDENSYVNRFTPRKSSSNWSAININKVEALINLGLMHEAGITAFNKRDEKKSRVYSFEQGEIKLLKEYEEQIKTNEKAWQYFQKQAPYYKN